MSTVLLDANVLLALGWRHHQFFPAAGRWYQELKGSSWATCPMTECAFLRISLQPKFQNAASAAQVSETLAGLCKGKGHEFWPDAYSPNAEPLFMRLQGHGQVTDAYLLLLAHRRKGRLATFDAGMKSLARELLGDERRVMVIPV